MSIPVCVLTGFLGSGKTTLLNRLLRDPAWADTAVIVNELGEIALDQELIASSEDNVKVLASGCLCCTQQGGLRETLADLFVQRVKGAIPKFARVIVETTGLADPGPVANSVVSDPLLRAEYRFAAIATTVDALHGADQIARFPEAARQVSLADLLVLTKTDLAPPDALRVALKEMNPVATFVERDAPLVLFFPEAGKPPGAFAGGGYSGMARPHSRARAMSFVIDHPVSWAGLAAWMKHAAEHFGERLLRVKGIFTMAEDGGAVAIHGIGRFFHPPERLGRKGDGAARLVCIGEDLDEAALAASLKLLEKEKATHGF
jgi:G3E family GTPase